MHDLFDFLKLKQHIKIPGKQINRLYDQILTKFVHRYLLALHMDLKNKIFTPYKKDPIHWRNTKMVNNILKPEKNHKKLKIYQCN